MKGRKACPHAVRTRAPAGREILEQPGVTDDEIDGIIPPQANRRIFETLAQDLAPPMDRFVITLDRSGDTSAAPIPPAPDAGGARRTKPTGDRIFIRAFGAGLTCGSALIRW